MPDHFRLEEAPRIDLETAKARFDQGTPLFVDVRSPEAYYRSHIPGTIHVPLKDILRRASDFPRDRLVIFG